MPQELNLNISPYFDDFGKDKDHYKVLFKPGYPVQARELTGLQSILQNQIEQFGNHLFKEGSVVIPGQVSYIDNYYAVELQSEYLGINILSYLNSLVGKTIRGQNTGVRAYVIQVLTSTDSERGNNTLYVNFIDSDYLTGSYQSFADDEVLILEEGLFGSNEIDSTKSVVIQPRSGFAVTIPVNCNSIGSAVFLNEGVYFLRGYFIGVKSQTLILDQYLNTPSYRVGLRISEETINADEDDTLVDNAKGFSNFSAPGADRLKITADLAKVTIDQYDVEEFVQLLEIRNGVLRSSIQDPQYNILQDSLAKRTYEESGDYYVTQPSVSPKETLNNLKGNGGVFLSNQLTYNNNTPTENLGTYQISPLKAVVKGYPIETISPTYIDFPKPRTTRSLTGQGINYVTGPTYTLNNVYGSPLIGINTNFTVQLMDSRKGVSGISSAGKEIGVARVYDFALESGSYTASNQNLNEWDIALYDVQTYTEITLNQNISLNVPTHVRGKSSGAVGFLRYGVSNNKLLTLYNVNGTFIDGEEFIFDGVDNTRISIASTAYGVDQVKSIFARVGTANTFNADIKPFTSFNVGFVTMTPRVPTGANAGICTVRSTNFNFVGIATFGSLVSFTNVNAGLSTVTFAKVIEVNKNNIIITGVTTVIGICDGALPTTATNPGDFKILKSTFQSSTDNTLYTVLPKKYISNVDIDNSSLIIKKSFSVSIASSQTNTIQAAANETFLPFDEERYTLMRDDGTVESLSSDKFKFNAASTTVRIDGLANATGGATLIASLSKTSVNNKQKNKTKVNILNIVYSSDSASGIGATTLNDGLLYGSTYPYGTRVQDIDICLLKPDITRVYGIFESENTSDAELPNILLQSLSGANAKTTDLLIGEEIEGLRSGAVAIYCEKLSDTKISYVLLNQELFQEGETIIFKTTGITATASVLITGGNNISSNYTFDNGQRSTIYDYGKIIRKDLKVSPTRRLKIVFEAASFLSSDNGDIITVNSYRDFDYCDIPKVNQISNADILDIRPRVSEFTVGVSTLSPFEFGSRLIDSSGASIPNILAPDEQINIGYSYYLPRIDRLFLTKDGIFQLNRGAASENPQLPAAVDEGIEIARATLPPYICNVNDIDIDVFDYKRYRMSDINKLENRIKNLEFYTTLSLLESDTSNLPIKDKSGLIRFKSGFFVDDFSSTKSQKKVTIVKNSIDVSNGELRPAPYTTEIDLQLGSTSVTGINGASNPTIDTDYVTDLIGSGVKKTGKLVTLNYTEVIEIQQPYATRIEKVAPVRSSYYGGTIELTPSSDVWVDQVTLNARKNEYIGDFTENPEQLEAKDNDKQSGFAPIIWGAWDKIWSGDQKNYGTSKILENYDVSNDVIQTYNRTGTKSTQSTRKIVKNIFNDVTFGDVSTGSQVIPYLRSRNIEFSAKRLKPFTRVYTNFDGQNVDKYIIPKLIQIAMISGSFQIGETVVGLIGSGFDINVPYIKFRVAQPNHKFGAYNAPVQVYVASPYSREIVLPSAYSTTATILNVDMFSLSQQSQGAFYGWIRAGMTLRGQTSGAEATISNVKLVTDAKGCLIGSLFIPDPNITSNPAFESGIKLFKLTSNNVNSQTAGVPLTSAEEKFYSIGYINATQENITSIRPVRLETQNTVDFKVNTSGSSTVISSTILGNNSPSQSPLVSGQTTPQSGLAGALGISGAQTNQFISGIQGTSTSTGSISPIASPPLPSTVAPSNVEATSEFFGGSTSTSTSTPTQTTSNTSSTFTATSDPSQSVGSSQQSSSSGSSSGGGY
jgi:hypothetical protein